MYKALISFSGLISMKKGEIKEITDTEIVEDLIKAGYIEEIKTNKEDIKKDIKEDIKETKKTNKKVKAKI